MRVLQQRASGGHVVIKEEQLPPSPVVRGEPFTTAMRPDHHKHADNKPSQAGHGQKSESRDLLFFFLQLSALKMPEKKRLHTILRLCVCRCVEQM